MWAGGTLSFPGTLLLGDRARRRSAIRSVEEKQGRTGRLVFIEVHHRIETERGPAIDETQSIVYREATAGAAPGGAASPGPPAWSDVFSADAVALFRFSALTFNGHRIHYDEPYARIEGYPGLVVHGPLLARLLLDAAVRQSARAPERFAYRALSPLFAGESFRLEGAGRPAAAPADVASDELWVAGPRGLAMRATAEWQASA
jgi:3-methylfumaryl-CoA hydratase